MAGTITICLTQRPDAAGGKLHWYRAGTVSTPQNAYYDSGLTLPLANPYTLDEDGNIPFFFLADGSIKITLVDRHGNSLLSQDNIPVIGSSSGGGGGGTVDPTSVWQTGDVKYRYGTGTLSGFVRMNSRTIGSATSGATERANADCQALFLYLWTTDTNLTVSTGRGLTAAADWAANKTITLPDGRARMLAGLADMGNSNSGALASNTFLAGNATTLGSALGSARATLLQANVPSYSITGSALTVSASGTTAAGNTSTTGAMNSNTTHRHTHNVTQAQFAISSGGTGPFLYGASIGGGASSTLIDTSNIDHTHDYSHTHTVTVTGSTSSISLSSGGSGTAFDIFSPALLITIYIKL